MICGLLLCVRVGNISYPSLDLEKQVADFMNHRMHFNHGKTFLSISILIYTKQVNSASRALVVSLQ